MKHPIAAVLAALVLFGQFAGNVRADITPEQVRSAINKSVAYLKREQKPNGSWQEYTSQVGGVSALCTLALLNAGVEPDEEHMKRALGFLRKLEARSTYVTSLQTMALCQAGITTDRIAIRDNVKWLESQQIVEGPFTGAWGYYSPTGGDKSNAQFAVLALHEAERAGIKVNSRTWRLARAYWEKYQTRGAWRYDENHGNFTGSMTCAGIASLIITSSKTRQSNAKVEGDRVECCMATEDDDDRIEQGMKWLGDHLSVERNPGENRNPEYWLFYYLYGLERVGRLSGQRLIGGHDWYREGCEFLINKKQASLSGSFKGSAPMPEQNELIATSLALLFLSKGRRPLLMAKLEHSSGNDWNSHRSDVAHLTQFVESEWKLDLTWQIVDLQAATVEDLLQSPVVYLCGKRTPLPTTLPAQRRLAQKLRDYIDRGGFVFAEGFRDAAEFDEGFRLLMKQVFDEDEYQLRPLEPEHPIWHAERRVAADQFRPLLGIEFGCRTSVVYAPPEGSMPSLSCLWELSQSGRNEQFSPKVQSQIDGALAIGVNVLAYATNRELAGKEDSWRLTAPTRADDKIDRSRLYIAKLRHPGGCNAAPRALVNLLETAGKEMDFRTGIRSQLLDITDEAIFDHHLVFMHGRHRFRLTPAERKQLKTYIERGGMLFADSICASDAFTESFREEMAAIFPEIKLEKIPESHPMFTSEYGGYDITTVTRRDPRQRRGDGPLEAKLSKVAPQMEGIAIDGRWRVIFSRYDISCALEKHDSLECNGYIRQDATRIGLNVILYSFQP